MYHEIDVEQFERFGPKFTPVMREGSSALLAQFTCTAWTSLLEVTKEIVMYVLQARPCFVRGLRGVAEPLGSA